jgi:glycosyltransferase involved in cell wall biosynthesis
MGSARKLHVAYLYQSAGTRLAESKAAQLHMQHIVRSLQAAGHDVTWVTNLPGRRVLCTRDVSAAEADGWRPRHCADLGFSGSKHFLAVESGLRRVQSALQLPYFALFDTWRMRAACIRSLRGCDVFHERYNLMGIGGALASRRMGIPLVLEVNADMIDEYAYQGQPLRGPRQAYAVWTTKLTFRTARAIICVSANLKRHLSVKWGIPARKVVVLPNAADVHAFGQAFHPQVYRKRLGVDDGPVVMFVGGFYRWHALDLLVESFALVVLQVPEAQLVLVGDGPVRAELEAKIGQLGMSNRVILAGALEHTQVPALLSIADVTVAPYARFPAGMYFSPLKLYEYMAAGKAIAATAAGQVAVVIRHGHNGLLVEPGDADAFAAAIVELLNDSAMRTRLGQNARRQAMEQHSWEHYVQKLEHMYRAVLSSRSQEVGR